MKKLLSKKAIFTLLITILLLTSMTTSFANTHEHTLSRMTSIMYSEYNSEKHIAGYTIYDWCRYCDYTKVIDKSTVILLHDLLTGNYHGTGTTHHVVRYCNDCTYDDSYTYTCPGNPCIHPNSVNHQNEDIDSLKKFENKLDSLNSILSKIKENSDTDNFTDEDIDSLKKFENELDSSNSIFSNLIKENSDTDNHQNEDIDSLKKSENKLDSLNSILSKIKENSNTDNFTDEDIDSLKKFENELDSLNSIFSNLIKENSNIDNFQKDFKNSEIEKTSCTNHKLNRYIASNFDDLGPSGHRYSYIEYIYCSNCAYIEYITELEQEVLPHNLSTGNYHGAGTTHHVLKYCNDCPYDDSYTYTCPGNPCISPLSVD